MTPEFSIESESREPSWGYTDLVIFVFLGMLSILICQLVVHGAVALFRGDARDGAVVLPAQVLLYGLLFTVLSAIIKLQYGREFWKSLAWVPAQVSVGACVLLGVVLALSMAWLGALLHTPDVDTPMKHLLARRGTAIAFALVGTTLGPLCEELIFRGFLQPVLVRSLGAALGIFVTAAFFGALHLAQYGFAWQAGVLIAVAGMAFGWMRQATGSTRASTYMHAAYNGCFFLLLFANGSHFTK